MSVEVLSVVVLLIPLAAAALTARIRHSDLAHAIGAVAMAACTVLAVVVAIDVVGRGVAVQGPHLRWLELGAFELGGFELGAGTFVDPLGAVMAVIVTALATLVLVFDAWYLRGDPLAARFPWQLCGFAFAMLAVVLADNLLMAFVGWELVGLGSYLLIGFWFHKPAASDDAEYQRNKGAGARGVIEASLSPSFAQQKAFVMNRVGDAGFLLGIGIVLVAALANGQRDPLSWSSLATLAAGGTSEALLTLAALGVFCGAIAKSAQFPLHPWLPDAMQGPTTASSIIHAATMVAAGVFLVARCEALFTTTALDVVGWIGGITCLLAAAIACVQWDLKAVLAYSTISQLGLMFVGLGAGPEAGGRAAGIAHLFTHAGFKCLLFLCAGAVIHACAGHQDLARLGGLRKRMPITAIASLLAVLAISGAPLTSGAFSKDGVLAAALAHATASGGLAYGPLVLAVIGSLLTAIYMFRWWLRLFAGDARVPDCSAHAHDPARSASVVLLVMAPFTLGLPWTFGGWLETALSGTRVPGAALAEAHHTATWIATALFVTGTLVAFVLFAPRSGLGALLARRLRAVHAACSELFWIDRIQDRVVARGLGRGLARIIARLDLGDGARITSLDGLIDGLGRGLTRIGGAGSLVHAGRLGVYVAVAAIAVTAVLFAVLAP
ncbi:MAG: hypothetical protein HZB39_21425 [Planctomycetes bacterium]|nr:hypothetical protein [Planctomycetota bacterium]